MSELGAVLPELEAQLGPLAGEPQPLAGGITNRNHRVRLGERDYVVRIFGRDSELLSIDRDTEVAAARAAHAAGVAPAVAGWLPQLGCLVTDYVSGRAMEPAEVREPAMLAQIAAALRRVHAGPALDRGFPSFTLARDYARRAVERGGGPSPEDHALALELSERIGGALDGRPGHEPVPCHNDLLASNFIRDGARVRIVDWEYAGMNDRFFDLGNLAVNNELSQDEEALLLESYFERPAGEPQSASLRLMRLMSDVREAMWGVLQAVLSDLDFDYAGYARRHFDRLREAAADPRLEDWLRAAAA